MTFQLQRKTVTDMTDGIIYCLNCTEYAQERASQVQSDMNALCAGGLVRGNDSLGEVFSFTFL